LVFTSPVSLYMLKLFTHWHCVMRRVCIDKLLT